MGETYYDRLGVSSDASTEEITTAYREKLKETHPDVSDERDAKERTKQLIEAKEVLTDEDERSRYDRHGHQKYVSLARQPSSTTASSGGTADTAANATRSADTTTGTTNTTSGTTDTADTAGTTGTTSTTSTTSDNTGTQTGAGNSRGDAGPSTSGSSTGGRASTARWYDGTSSEHTATSRGQRDESNTWRAWNTSGSYAIRGGGDTFQYGKLFSSNRAFVLLGITFLVYPVLVFGALYPHFPLGLRLAIGMCGVLLVAFLQSIPEVGIAVFGVWSLLLPVMLFGTSLPVFAFESALAMVAVLFPLGLSILTRIAIRPVSV